MTVTVTASIQMIKSETVLVRLFVIFYFQFWPQPNPSRGQATALPPAGFEVLFLLDSWKLVEYSCFLCTFGLVGLPGSSSTVEPLLYDHPQNHIGVVV